MNLESLKYIVYVIDGFLLLTLFVSLSLSVAKVKQALTITKLLKKGVLASEQAAQDLYWGMGLLKSISSTSTLVGLAGTVISIMAALQLLGTAEIAGNFLAIAKPVGAALQSTFLGICASIPAQFAVSFISVRLNALSYGK